MFDKEAIKEFLNPDWRKILLSFIIIVTGLSLRTCDNLFCGIMMSLIFSPVILLIILISPNALHKGEVESGLLASEQGFILSYAFMGIWWYLFSCLIIYAYDKFKTKK